MIESKKLLVANDEYKTFLVEYQHDGHSYGLEPRAESFEDAEARLYRIGMGNVLGEAVATIPAFGRSTWLADMIVRTANFFKRLH